MLQNQGSERSALASMSQKGSQGGGKKIGKGSISTEDKDKLKCEHCGRSRHTKETCWEPFTATFKVSEFYSI